MNKKEKRPNSHKYFPEFMVSAFLKRKGGVCFNVSINKAGQVVGQDPNEESGFYNNKNEIILNKQAEDKFQKLSLKLTKICRAKKYGHNSSKTNIKQIINSETDTIYKFFAYQILRDPANSEHRFHKLTKKDAIQPKIFNLQKFQNKTIEIEYEYSFNIDHLKQSFLIVPKLNTTNTKYIAISTPINIKLKEGDLCIFNSSPEVSFCLISKNRLKTLDANVLEYNAELAYVKNTNEHIMAHAIKYEPHLILGTDYSYLKNLWKKIQHRIAIFD